MDTPLLNSDHLGMVGLVALAPGSLMVENFRSQYGRGLQELCLRET